MPADPTSSPADLIDGDREELLRRWLAEQQAAGSAQSRISDADLERQCDEVLVALVQGLRSGSGDVSGAGWATARATLRGVALARVRHGFSPSDTALFVFSLKQPLFSVVGSAGADVILQLNDVMDRLGLHTIEIFQQAREEIILRQQQEMLELSTPVVKLWDRILAVPLIGTLDSERTQVVMETLLQSLLDIGSTIAIIDITGVPTVDTKVAQHLIQTVSAARLMGADCIISGIRPQIAQTIIHLGVDLSDVITKASLADAFQVALHRLGREVVSSGSRGTEPR